MEAFAAFKRFAGTGRNPFCANGSDLSTEGISSEMLWLAFEDLNDAFSDQALGTGEKDEATATPTTKKLKDEKFLALNFTDRY